MKIKLQRKKSNSLTNPSTTLTILTGIIVALAATAGALFAKLRAKSDPEKFAIQRITAGTEMLQETIDMLPEGSRIQQTIGPKLQDIRAAVEERAANGTKAPAQIH